jgi:hypothetical protein
MIQNLPIILVLWVLLVAPAKAATPLDSHSHDS